MADRRARSVGYSKAALIACLAVFGAGVAGSTDACSQGLPVKSAEVDTQSQPATGQPRTLLGSEKYEAFPYVVMSTGGDLVGLFSVGEGHGHRTTHVLGTMRSGGDWNFVVAFERGQMTPDAKAALLSVLGDGETVLLKAWWIKRAGNEVHWIRSEVQEPNVSLWGKPLSLDNRILRPGFTSRGPEQRAVLMESLDGGRRWHIRSMILEQPGRRFTEAAIIGTGGRNLLAIVREQDASGPGQRPRRLHVLRSGDGGLSWSSPEKSGGAQLSGTQPELLRLKSGAIVFCAGDRTGASGLSRSGTPTDAHDATGIHCYSSTDNGSSWHDSGMMARSISTDAGQPQLIELADQRILMVYYVRRSDDRLADVEQVIVPERTLLGH